MVLAAEKIDDGTAINLGTEEAISVMDAARLILEYSGHEAEIKLLTHMPTGPLNRVASNRLAHSLLGWQPKTKFADGLRQTVDWYFATKNRDVVGENFAQKLIER
jgi:nucleoside-diphosphate-sugar epimerase